jgi:transcriptional regulator with PAS, ATPase and Fis domain
MKVQHQMLGDQDVIRTGCSLFVVSRRPTVDLPWLRDHGIATRCGVMAQRIALICRAAEMKLNVLCSGETGTGKEVLARLLHSLSKRPGRMVAVNCAAIPDGLVEAHLFGAMKGAYTGLEENRQGVFAAAHRGTLLLDEVGELPESAQIKLLRVLEDRQVVPLGSTQPIPVDVQIVAATNNQDVLEQTTGKFRGDLLARLEDVVVEIPPLRQRKVDILPLACLQLAELSVSSCVMDPDFAEALLVAPWPRNVRQLLKAVSRGAALREPHQSLRLDALDVGFPTSAAAPNNTSELPAVKHPRTRPPKEEFLDVYRACNANISAISRHFGVERKQVYRWLSIWGIGR